MSSNTTQFEVTIPTELFERLGQYVSDENRNQFIVDVIDQELRRLKIEKALNDPEWSWASEKYPELDTVEGVNQYLGYLRGHRRI